MRIPLYAKITVAGILLLLMAWTYSRLNPKVVIGQATFTVEVAVTDAKRERGLGYRDTLPPLHGMLFVYPAKGDYAFWMKGMRFPLDFVWISGTTVVDITQNVPVSPGPDFPLYRPKAPADKILEINAGEIRRAGIKIGDSVRFRI
jgi:uncharacterized membrane protein (UPF0127 family)